MKYLTKHFSFWVCMGCLLKNLTWKCKMFCLKFNNEMFCIILGHSGVLINQIQKKIYFCHKKYITKLFHVNFLFTFLTYLVNVFEIDKSPVMLIPPSSWCLVFLFFYLFHFFILYLYLRWKYNLKFNQYRKLSGTAFG